MATLQVGLDDPFSTIRSAIKSAASGDTILLDPGSFNITSLTTPAATGAAPATFSQFGAKALSVVGAGKALTTVVGNARIYVGQLDRSGGVPLDLNLSNFRLQYALASGYILQYGDYLFNSLGYDQGGNLYYGAANAIVGLSLADLSFSGSHAGAGFGTSYLQAVAGYTSAGSGRLDLSLDRLDVTLTGQAGFNGSTGGGSFLYAQGDGITLRRSTFDEAGYRSAFTIVDSSNVTISGNTFRRSANRTVRASGEIIQNSSGTIAGNVFRDGAYLDLRNFSRDSLILANNSFDLSGVSNPTGQFGGSDPFAILVRNSSALSSDLALTFTGVNSFTGGLPIKNLTTATATLAGTFQFKTQADPTAAGVSAFNLVVGGTGSDRNLKGTGSSDWISLDAGDDRIDAGFGFDSLLGGSGNDTLDGGSGRDTLVGGSGADRFVFDSYLSAATNIDTITDFSAAAGDRLVLDRAIFTTLNSGDSLSGSAFRAGAGLVSATTAADRILYDTSSGALRYDADGSGSVYSAVQFATLASAPLATAPSLSASAFHLVGADPVAPTTEAKPTLSVGPKLNITVVPTAADTTSTAWNWVSAATDAVTTGSVKLDNRTGPTMSARFYGMLGSALYEAWQVFDSEAESSIATPSSSERWDRAVEQQIKGFFKGIGEEFEFDGGSTIGSGDDDEDDDEGDDDHPLSPTAAKLMESVVARTTFAVLSSPLSGIQAGSAGLARLNAQLQSTLSTISPAQTALFNGIDQQISQTVAARVLASFQNDGSSLTFAPLQNPITLNAPAYVPVNSGPNNVTLIDQWTPEYSVNSNPATPLQVYLTPTWGDVQYYLFPTTSINALTAQAGAAEAFLLDPNDTYNLQLGLIYDDGVGPGVAIAPDQVGKTINPGFINQANEVVAFNRQLTDPEGNNYKGIAQFWENGGGTAFPPGTWMKFGQYASLDHNNSLGDDAKLFLGLGASVYTASIAAWDLKLQENSARPIRVIRELSRFGLMEDVDNDPTNGSQFQAYVRGQGLQTINGTSWETYQTPGPYSPPFPELVSGHSTFSAAAADFLTNFYGSGEFGGKVDFNLSFPYDPANQAVSLSWDTWKGAAEEAGFSRLWGGIHFLDGNLEGQQLGTAIGSQVFGQLSNLWS